MLKRIESLERLLAEERRKNEAAGGEKKTDDPMEADLHLREREILQQEVCVDLPIRLSGNKGDMSDKYMLISFYEYRSKYYDCIPSGFLYTLILYL